MMTKLSITLLTTAMLTTSAFALSLEEMNSKQGFLEAVKGCNTAAVLEYLSQGVDVNTGNEGGKLVTSLGDEAIIMQKNICWDTRDMMIMKGARVSPEAVFRATDIIALNNFLAAGAKNGITMQAKDNALGTPLQVMLTANQRSESADVLSVWDSIGKTGGKKSYAPDKVDNYWANLRISNALYTIYTKNSENEHSWNMAALLDYYLNIYPVDVPLKNAKGKVLVKSPLELALETRDHMLIWKMLERTKVDFNKAPWNKYYEMHRQQKIDRVVQTLDAYKAGTLEPLPRFTFVKTGDSKRPYATLPITFRFNNENWILQRGSGWAKGELVPAKQDTAAPGSTGTPAPGQPQNDNWKNQPATTAIKTVGKALDNAIGGIGSLIFGR